MSGAPHITVCVCTYKRPHLLERLFLELDKQETGKQFTFSVVVCDNDSKESARQVLEQLGKRVSFEVEYCVEPEQNIALARNRALANATCEYVACMDDDEFPERNWLLTLFETCNKYNADGVLGPVKPFFEKQPPRWIIKGKIYDRPAHETGFVIPWTEGRTGNVLFKREILNGVDPVFRPEFRSGGEDRNFFMRMIEAGRVFIWCDEAVAYEIVPPARWTRSFMLRRALLRGKMSLNHSTIGLKGVVVSLAAVIAYSLALPLLFLSGQHHFMNYLIKVCDHAGRLMAFLGLHPIKESYVTE